MQGKGEAQVFLSRLALNPSCRQVRAELLHPYQLHRTLLRSFSSAFAPQRVLYRLETLHGVPVVLLQSARSQRTGGSWRPASPAAQQAVAGQPEPTVLRPSVRARARSCASGCGPTRLTAPEIGDWRAFQPARQLSWLERRAHGAGSASWGRGTASGRSRVPPATSRRDADSVWCHP